MTVSGHPSFAADTEYHIGYHMTMSLAFGGAVIDVPVRDIERAEQFYTILIGRQADLQVRPTEREWRLHQTPEVALRLIVDPARAGHGRVRIGVQDLAAERSRLASSWQDIAEVTLWQDLLVRAQ